MRGVAPGHERDAGVVGGAAQSARLLFGAVHGDGRERGVARSGGVSAGSAATGAAGQGHDAASGRGGPGDGRAVHAPTGGVQYEDRSNSSGRAAPDTRHHGACRRQVETIPGAFGPIRNARRRDHRAAGSQGQETRRRHHRSRSGRQVTMMSTSAQTPLMQQYREIKGRHQNAILFFRMGEFYEMFYDDAETASRVLGLTLTSRNNGGAADVPLAGVPVKAAGEYVRRLVQQGFRVAICEQTEDPKVAKGVVRREVIETVSPGVALADDLLDGTRNNFICAICAAREPDRTYSIGLAAADVSTGELRLVTTSLGGL